MAPTFKYQALGPKPPGPTPLLKDAPRIVFVPAQRTTQAKTIQPDQVTLDTSAQNQTNSPLLRLPSEMRTKIFIYACTTNEVIELRSCKPPVAANTKDEDTEMKDIDQKAPTKLFPLLLTSRQLYTETSLLPFTHNTVHCTNLWDLRICQSRMTRAQRSAIRVFKLRWHTAECCLWEISHPSHAFKTSSSAIGMLTGLEKVVVAGGEDKGKFARDRMKKELEKWVDGVLEGVVVEVDGEKEEKKHEASGRWGLGSGWGWGSLKPLGG